MRNVHLSSSTLVNGTSEGSSHYQHVHGNNFRWVKGEVDVAVVSKKKLLRHRNASAQERENKLEEQAVYSRKNFIWSQTSAIMESDFGIPSVKL
jgi:hypothetical protein